MEKIEAIKKIKKHLDHNTDTTQIYITPSLVLYWWHKFNIAVFDRKLKIPSKIVCRKFRDGSLGWCQGFHKQKDSAVILGIRSELNNKRIFFTVLIHEMVHQWEQQEIGVMKHGKAFFSWRNKIYNTLQLPLKREVDI